jgi:2,3-bisphosphoglycerate-independent phosphoglycerate mutase
VQPEGGTIVYLVLDGLGGLPDPERGQTELQVADYPMYRGVSRLLGLEALPPPGGLEARFQALASCHGDTYSFYFLHVKRTDSSGEDADFDAKVHALEAVDRLVPQVTALEPDVLVAPTFIASWLHPNRLHRHFHLGSLCPIGSDRAGIR